MTLINPVITEKSMLAASRGLYTFHVSLSATKSKVKEEVQKIFKVTVVSVNILSRHVRAKSTGAKRIMGSPSQKRIAMLKLKKGQTIDLFDLKDGN